MSENKANLLMPFLTGMVLASVSNKLPSVDGPFNPCDFPLLCVGGRDPARSWGLYTPFNSDYPKSKLRPHQLKRRAKAKMARKSRKINRGK